jgi:integrase
MPQRLLHGQVVEVYVVEDKGRDRALLTLAVTTGMRQGKIFALTWDDVDLDARTIAIKSTLADHRDGHLVRSEPKTAKSRRVKAASTPTCGGLTSAEGFADFEEPLGVP